MKCPFLKKDINMSAYQFHEEFNDCYEIQCMAYNSELKICNLCSDKRIFKIRNIL